MIPVYQTKFGKPDGNCHAACLASILEIPLESIPEFGHRSDWYDRFCEFMARYGLEPVVIPADGWRPAGYYLINGIGPRGIQHSVVAKNGEMVHDPFPGGGGVRARSFTIFLFIDPAQCPKAGTE